ncbi:MAG: hypothetical protein AAB391_03415 [Patescibacteria group bacterium]
MVDALNLGTQFSVPTLPSEPGVGRKGWKVVFEVVVVLLLASALIGWFAMTRNQTSTSSLLPNKEELLRKMAERPAVSLTNTEKQSLMNAMANPGPIETTSVKVVNGKTTTVKTSVAAEPSVTLTDAQRADLLQKMTEGK